MTAEEIKQLVLRVLGDIAPEAELDDLDPANNFRDQLDIDSMDFLNFVIALHEEFDVDIPEIDYPKLSSLEGCISYLAARIISSTIA